MSSRLPLALEITIQHNNREQVGAVALHLEHHGGDHEWPIHYQLLHDDDPRPVQEKVSAYFFVRQPGRYKLAGVWKDGFRQESKPVELLPGMFTPDGWDGLTPELRRKQEVEARRRQAATQTPPSPPAAPTRRADPKDIVIGVLTAMVVILIAVLALT